MSINTTPEMYDDNIEYAEGQTASMSQEEILMSENELLAGLIDLGKSKDETENYHKIQIKRNGVLKLEFRIRPLTEDELQICTRRATKYALTKPGQPRKPLETDGAKSRSFVIYTATVDEDRAKTWDNKAAQEANGVFQAVDLIDKVLFGGEKNRVIEKIEEISGYSYDDGEEADETAKN